jgi:hypothetical protein
LISDVADFDGGGGVATSPPVVGFSFSTAFVDGASDELDLQAKTKTGSATAVWMMVRTRETSHGPNASATRSTKRDPWRKATAIFASIHTSKR